MKLNPDCVRDLMLALEEMTDIYYDHGYLFKEINCSSFMRYGDFKSKYGRGEIAYTLLQLAESGYISMEVKVNHEACSLQMGNILYITPKGRDFITSVQNKKDWKEKIMPAFKLIGNVSLSAIEAISKGVSTALIEKIIQDTLEQP